MRTPRLAQGSLLLLALVCLVPAVWGGVLAFGEESGWQALGFALLGFFGAGVVVLTRKAFGGG